jgi:hypothetical protein
VHPYDPICVVASECLSTRQAKTLKPKPASERTALGLAGGRGDLPSRMRRVVRGHDQTGLASSWKPM